MKNKKIIIIIGFMILILFSSIIFIYLSKNNEVEEVDPELNLTTYFTNLDNTNSFNYLESLYDVDISLLNNNLTISILDGEIEYIYEIILEDEMIEFTLDKSKEIDSLIFNSIIESFYQSAGYDSDIIDFISFNDSNFISQLNIIETQNQGFVFDYKINLNDDFVIPEEYSYNDFNNLKTSEFSNNLFTTDYAVFTIGEISLIKRVEEEQITILITETNGLSENSYDVVMILAELLLDDNYNGFEKEYPQLIDYNYDDLTIDIDYDLSTEENFEYDNINGFIKIYFNYDF